MSRIVQRPGLTAAKVGRAAAATTLALLALTGCGTGAISQTATQSSAVNGYSGGVGNMAVRDAIVAFPDLGNAPMVSRTYDTGGTAPLSMSLVNTGATADRLLSVSSPVAASGQVVGDATIPGGGVIAVGNNAGASSQSLATRTIAIKLVGLVGPIRAGLTYPVVLRFERAGTLTAQLPVGYPSGEQAERK